MIITEPLHPEEHDIVSAQAMIAQLRATIARQAEALRMALSALKASRRTIITAVSANVGLDDFDPTEHIGVQRIDVAITAIEEALKP